MNVENDPKALDLMEARRYSNFLLPWLCEGRITGQFLLGLIFELTFMFQGLILTAAQNN